MHGERAGGEQPTARELQPWGGADVAETQWPIAAARPRPAAGRASFEPGLDGQDLRLVGGQAAQHGEGQDASWYLPRLKVSRMRSATQAAGSQTLGEEPSGSFPRSFRILS